MDATVNRIDTVLADQPPGLWPFLPAGYPDLETTAAFLKALDALPIRGVELGIPFSDPIADGPVIQRAFSAALSDGLKLRDVFAMVSALRGEVRYPLLAMVSASIVYCIGIEAFVSHASGAGFDGLIVPDISLEEAPRLAEATGGAGLRLSMLIAPTTPKDRRERIADVSSGFLYYVSVQGTTGARASLPADLKTNVCELKDATGSPVLVGFGISSVAQVREVCRYADGAIAGSAIVRRITELCESGRRGPDMVTEVTAFIRELAEM
jgi:tryptophan synthase alpha chain